MKTKKRKKNTRQKGRAGRTCGWGFRQKHKGHGNKGGRGMAGSGKRADQKKQKALNIATKSRAKSYFGAKGFTSRRTGKNKMSSINLYDVREIFLNKKQSEIDLSKYKILGKGDGFKAIIKARKASKSAVEKMEKAGGKIILPEKKDKKKIEKKQEKDNSKEEKNS